MNQELIELEAERIVKEASESLTAPEIGECLVCYVDRQVRQLGCDETQRFIAHFRDRRVPRATKLTRKISQCAGSCDCQFVSHTCMPIDDLWLPGDTLIGDCGVVRPEVMPPCSGVRSGSSRPCTNWAGWRYWETRVS